MSFVPTVTIELKEYQELYRLSKVAFNSDNAFRVLEEQYKTLQQIVNRATKLDFDRQMRLIFETIDSLRGKG